MTDYEKLHSRRGPTRTELIVGSLIAATVIGVLAAVVIYLTRTDGQTAKRFGLPIPVQTLPAAVTKLHETIGASGTIQPSVPLAMTAQVVGRVIKVAVDIGTVVRPNDLLVEIDDRLFRADLKAANLKYYDAQVELQRLESLLKRNFAAPAEVERARADLAATYAAKVKAEIDLENTRVLSPAPAVVLERIINPGETTRVDGNLLMLGVLDPVYMVAEVSQDKAGSVHLGMPAEVGTDEFAGETFRAKVVKIEATVNEATRTFGVYLQIANHDLRLKQGATGYARLENDRMALAIPSTALMNPVGDRAAVFVVAPNGRAHLREVRRGLMVAGMTEILDGLQEGEKIVTVGQLELRDNDPVSANRYAPWNKQ